MARATLDERISKFVENQITDIHHLDFGYGYPLVLRLEREEYDWVKEPCVEIEVDKKLPVRFARIDGKVELSSTNLKTLAVLPNHVEGLDVSYASLTRFTDCPRFVHGDFDCSYNHLTSMEGCPSLVEGNFVCYGNDKAFFESEVRSHCVVYGEVLNNKFRAEEKLAAAREKQREYELYVAEVLGLDREQTTMKCIRRMGQVWVMGNRAGEPVQATVNTKYLQDGGLPFYIREFNGSIAVEGASALTTFRYFPPRVISLDVRGQQLSSLRGMPEVEVDLLLDGNQLTSLEGCPHLLEGDFHCDDNQLTTLEGAPQVVGGSVWCSGRTLTTLKGGPAMVGGDYWCDSTGVTTLEGFPKYVGGKLDCHDCARPFTEEEVRQHCTAKEVII